MYKHIAEAFVPVAHARSIAERLCTKCCGYCLAVDASDAEKLLTFEDARAILRPAGNGLQMRVESKNVVVLCGVRTLLQGQLATVATIHAEAVKWQVAGPVPFRTGGMAP